MARHLNDILLPVETVTRELDAKLLLALFAAEAGFRCHIGAMSRIQAPGFPPSIYISKSVRFAKAVKLMRGLGHAIAAWDEEGLARFNDRVHGSRLEPEAFSLPHILFSWGKSNSDLWRKHPFYKDTPIIDAGNPRIDLLRPELRAIHTTAVADIRKRFGQFALLNSNFGIVNHFKATGRKAKISNKSQDAAAFVAFRHGVEAHKRRLFEAFLTAIPAIAAAIAPHGLVIRPHPSEDHAAWRQAANGLSNVTVIHEGPVVPWLLAARCLIHNGCTSAIEAAVLGLPRLAYRPVRDEEFDIALPNALSENFTAVAALTARTRYYLDGNSEGQHGPYPQLLHDNIAALDGAFSCERIVAALGSVEESSAAALGARLSAHGQYLYRRIKHQIDRESRRYEEHKSQANEFTPERVATRARPMAEALGRFAGLAYEQRAPGVVTISRKA